MAELVVIYDADTKEVRGGEGRITLNKVVEISNEGHAGAFA
jgi:hypothetical protein